MLPRFIHQWSLRPGRLCAAALSLAILLALVPLASAEVTPDDPLVDDVVRMLDAGIESDLVVSWLKTGDRRPAALSADALIALSQAQGFTRTHRIPAVDDDEHCTRRRSARIDAATCGDRPGTSGE